LDIGGNDVNSDCTSEEEKAGDAGDLMPPIRYGDRFQDRILMGFNNSPLLYQFLLKNLKGEVVNLPRLQDSTNSMKDYVPSLPPLKLIQTWIYGRLPTYKVQHQLLR